jgi:uncharacterized protein
MSAASDASGAGRWVPPPSPESLSLAPGIRLNFCLNVQEESYIMSNRSFRLMEYHQKLDDELRSELRRSWPSFDRIQRLKRLKLAVKDKLQRLATIGKSARTA